MVKIRKKYAAKSDCSHTSDNSQRLWLLEDSYYGVHEKDGFVAKGCCPRWFYVLIDMPLPTMHLISIIRMPNYTFQR